MKKYNVTKKKLLNTYNATYTTMDLLCTLLVYCFAIALVCYLQKLNMLYSILLIVSALCILPLMISAFFKYKHEKKRFEAYCLYFESVKLFFKTHGKIIIALEETYKLFDKNSDMGGCIAEAILEIKTTGDYKKALSHIEENYHNTYIERFHNLLITGEKQGANSVFYNLDAINYPSWKKDIMLYQKKKKTVLYMFYLMAGLSIGISIYSIVMYTSDIKMMHTIVSNSMYQLYTFLELEIMLLLFIYVYIGLVNKKWIRSDE